MGPLWGGKGCQGKDKSVCSLWTVPGHLLQRVCHSPGRVESRGCRTAGQQKFKHPRGVSAQQCMSWVDLDESLWSWLEGGYIWLCLIFKGLKRGIKAYKHLDPLSLLKWGK